MKSKVTGRRARLVSICSWKDDTHQIKSERYSRNSLNGFHIFKYTYKEIDGIDKNLSRNNKDSEQGHSLDHGRVKNSYWTNFTVF